MGEPDRDRIAGLDAVHVRPGRSSTGKFRSAWRSAAVLLLMATASMAVVPAHAQGPTEVEFTSDGNTLHGLVTAPPGEGRRPAVVLLAGAGSSSRRDNRAVAEAFAAKGIVTLTYDKRAGYSRATTSFDDLARDAIAGVDLLRGRPDVDPARVGVWGHSQGGWVAPLAATMSDHVSFVVTVAASGLRADRTQLWSNRTYLAHAGVRPSLVEPVAIDLSRMLMAVGLFGDTGNDPVANLERVRQPVLAVFGEHDRSTVPGESLRIFREALDRGGNRNYALRVIKDADHNMRQSEDGFADTDGPLAAGYLDTVTSWINGLGGTPSRVVDEPPGQAVESAPVRPLEWYESPWLHVAAVVVMLLAFLAYPVVAAVRRVRGRRGRPAVAWPSRVVAAVGPLVVLGTVGYLGSVVVTGAVEVDGAVLGRPAVWAVLQLASVGVVVAAVVAGVRRKGDGVRVGLLLAGTAVFVPWAAYWGLFTV